MLEEVLEILKRFDSIYLASVGDPRLPDDITLHGLLLPIEWVRTLDPGGHSRTDEVGDDIVRIPQSLSAS